MNLRNEEKREWRPSKRLLARQHRDTYKSQFAESYDAPPRNKGVRTNKRRKAQLAKIKKKRSRR